MGHLTLLFSSSMTVRTDTRCGRPSVAVGVCLWLAILVLAASVATARSWSYDLAGDLMSPYCPGRTLASCPSPQAAELVQWIAVQEAGGATQEEVVEMLIERFGEEILGAPPATGITLWAYLLPVLGFVGGGGLVVVALRRIVVKDSTAKDSVTKGIGTKDSVTKDSVTKDSVTKDSVTKDSVTDPALEDGAGSLDGTVDDDLAKRVDADLAELAARS